MTVSNITVVHSNRSVARPLKVLVPLIKTELKAGNRAGVIHYMRAGQMLCEAKGDDKTPGQVPPGSWSKWLKQNFELSKRTAQLYMQYAHLPRQFRRK
jgi:hypothetical protein